MYFDLLQFMYSEVALYTTFGIFDRCRFAYINSKKHSYVISKLHYLQFRVSVDGVVQVIDIFMTVNANCNIFRFIKLLYIKFRQNFATTKFFIGK